MEETAEVLRISVPTAKGCWPHTRAWLVREIATGQEGRDASPRHSDTVERTRDLFPPTPALGLGERAGGICESKTRLAKTMSKFQP